MAPIELHLKNKTLKDAFSKRNNKATVRVWNIRGNDVLVIFAV